MKSNGVITSAYGRMYTVKVANNYYQCVTKAKRCDYVVGDEVIIDIFNNEQAQIIELLPRSSLIYRTDRHKSKQIASNINQIIIVTAVKPNYNLDFIGNSLIFAESEGIKPIIVVNKSDLIDSADYINLINKIYGQIGYTVVAISGIKSIQKIAPLLDNKCNVLIGQSGVGKSTIINQLLNKQSARTNQIMKSNNSGRHTTTNAMMYFINDHTTIIDCPGLQEFGLYHLDVTRLIEYFPEFRAYIGQCKFANCKHIEEPKCAVRESLKNESNYRYEYYKRLYVNIM